MPDPLTGDSRLLSTQPTQRHPLRKMRGTVWEASYARSGWPSVLLCRVRKMRWHEKQGCTSGELLDTFSSIPLPKANYTGTRVPSSWEGPCQRKWGHSGVKPWSLGKKQPQGSEPGTVALTGPAKGTPRTTYGWAHQFLCSSSRPPPMQLNVTVCACVCKGEGCREDAVPPSRGSGHTGNPGPGVCGPRPDRVGALAPFFSLAQHTAFLLGR